MMSSSGLTSEEWILHCHKEEVHAIEYWLEAGRSYVEPSLRYESMLIDLPSVHFASDETPMHNVEEAMEPLLHLEVISSRLLDYHFVMLYLAHLDREVPLWEVSLPLLLLVCDPARLLLR